MNMRFYFEEQVRLLLEVLDTVMSNPLFILKGGTAINFFHSNLPRLSVDIDLAYAKVNSRDEFLKDNVAFWESLSKEVLRKHSVRIHLVKTNDGIPIQMKIFSSTAEIKVEVNLVLRGAVFPTMSVSSCEAIASKYGLETTLSTLSQEELYAGKFCAALDRQHPRDLFDVLVFFENHTFNENYKMAFLAYLISANRPISELINPHRLDQKKAFKAEFSGMTYREVSYHDLELAREKLIHTIKHSLNHSDREFLISFKQGEPDWQHINLPDLASMPAIQWKLLNIKRMDKDRHKAAVLKLKQKLNE